jgi:hypothetical protein
MSNLSRKLSQHLSTLADVALKSDMTHQHSAGIIVGGKMVAVGWNQGQRTKMGHYYGPSLHAEPAALARFVCQQQYQEKWVL